MQKMIDVTRKTLGWMASGPDSLARGLAASSDDAQIVARFVEHVRTASSSDPVFNLLNQRLSSWDYDGAAAWADGTASNSTERRQKIYELLKVDSNFATLLHEKFPPNVNYDAPIVIAKEHTPWYDGERQGRQSFYRDAYANYLRTQKGWTEDQIMGLEESTRLVTERLSDPENPEIHPVRGLVVGYVQSGKTANFTGVVARAADAGYRLIVVLAGTLNILRAQTQRRMDRELIGLPFITAKDDPEYATDLKNFIDHGGQPSEQGAFDWYRLTGSGKDYQRLLYGIDALRFRKQHKNKPFNDPSNLHEESARLLIVKKNPSVLRKFAEDLSTIKKTQNLTDIPTLVIDDESDQASINTKKPTAKEIQERTATNSAIVSLLKELPRAQYVGYTATPFANVFVDPNNDEDLFPRDFIISLPRPVNYMGVADFHDLDRPDRELPGPNELDFVRNVVGEDTDPDNLQRAIDSYILAGALKLYRADRRPELAKAYRHHTMLVHISHLTDSHDETAALVTSLLGTGGYLEGTARPRLKKLWEKDFERVCKARADMYPVPAGFKELAPFLGDCWARLTSAFKPVLTVNGDSADNPDFESSSVWKIVVGGAKLSRGYTIEGLTVSYYRRRAGAADSLMQMGRWFGFRDGYRDLVRLYIGREEPVGKAGRNAASAAENSGTKAKAKAPAKGSPAPVKKTVDLYRAFEAACLDEMEFRDELKRYANPLDGKPILPIQVPPLVPSHLLRPTSTNKMYNTRIEFKNFAQAWKEHTVAPVAHDDIVFNQQLLAALIAGELETGTLSVTNAKGTFTQPARWKTIGTAAMLDFLRSYRWASGDITVLQRETEFLMSEKNGVTEWLFVYFEGPQRSKYCTIGDRQFRVYNRSRTDERFNVYSESVHRPIVKYLCGVEEAEPDNDTTRSLRNGSRAVFVFYPTADIEYKDEPNPPAVTPGFALQFPGNSNPMQIRFTVLVKSREHEPIADADAADLPGKALAAKGLLVQKKVAHTAGKGK
jgi:hypothetical protein